MKPEQIHERVGQIIESVSAGESAEWGAKQWREFSRQVNLFVGEGWEKSACPHDGLRYQVSGGERCGICLRSVE